MDQVFWHCQVEYCANRLLQKWPWKSGNISFFLHHHLLSVSFFLCWATESDMESHWNAAWTELCFWNHSPQPTSPICSMGHCQWSPSPRGRSASIRASLASLFFACDSLKWSCFFFFFWLNQDYLNFMAYICKAYKGSPAPDACRAILLDDRQYLENVDGGSQVCYATATRNSTS